MPDAFIQQTLDYFAQQINCPSDKAEDIEDIELTVNGYCVTFQIHEATRTLLLAIDMGHFATPPSLQQLEKILQDQFLGAQTAGCRFTLRQKMMLYLDTWLSPDSSLPDRFEKLDLLLLAAEHWAAILKTWPNFVCHVTGSDDQLPPLSSSFMKV
jgi:hypothetical protein